MNMPEPVTIAPSQYERLIKQQDAIQALQNMMDMFQNNYKSKMMAAQQETRKIWEEIARDTGIDIENVFWAPHMHRKNVIMPMQVNLGSRD